MSLIHQLSSTTTLPEFDIFRVPPTQRSVWKDVVTEHRPICVIEKGSPIPFEFRSEANEFIKFNESMLYLKYKIKLSKTDKSVVKHEDWASIVPVNNFIHSIFDKVELSVNQVQLTMAASNYAYRAYMEKLLGFSKSSKEGFLCGAMWGDRGERTEAITPEKTADQSEITIELMDKIHFDLTFQNRAFLGNSTFSIKLYPSPPSFHFEVPTGYQLITEIKEPILYVHRSYITDSLSTAIGKALKIAPAKYPITRTEIKHFTLEKGVIERFINHAIDGVLPRRIFVMMVDQAAFSGSVTKNPFYFEHNNLNHLVCYLGGTSFPSQPMTPDFKNNLFVKEFMALYQALNQNGTDTYTELSRKDFKDGNAIFAINLTPDLSSGPGAVGHYNLQNRGELRLHVKFASELTKTTTLLMYQEFDSIIEVDEIGQVHTNYTS